MVETVNNILPVYTDKDIIVVSRDKVIEVWTEIAFKTGELTLGPVTTTLVDRFWTQGRSHAIKNCEGMHPNMKHLALDGRHRATPKEGHELSLFFAITRSHLKDKHNTQIHYTRSTSIMTIDLNKPAGKGGSQEVTRDANKVPSIPLMTNPKALTKHVQLFVADDEVLLSLAQKQKEEKIAETAKGSKKASDDATAKKRKPGATPDTEPPAKK